MELKDRELTNLLKNGYPRTPERFRETVADAVREATRRRTQDNARTDGNVTQYLRESGCTQHTAGGSYTRSQADDSSAQHTFDGSYTQRKTDDSYTRNQMNDNFASRTVSHSTSRRSPGRSSARRSTRRRLLIALPAAALIVLGCGTAIASGRLSLDNWLKGLGANRQAAEEYVQTEPAVDYSSGRQVVEIQEYYFDGNKLVLVAKAADGSGALYSSKDHAYVNGTDCRTSSYQNPDNPTEMIYELELSDEVLQASGSAETDDALRTSGSEGADEATLNVRMRFYVGDAIEECTFDLRNINPTAEVTHIPDQTIELKSGSVEVTNLTVSLSGISASLHFSFEGEDADTQIGKYSICYELSDSSGNTVNSLMNDSGVTGMSLTDPVRENGTVSRDLSFTVTKLDASSESLTLTPYIPEEDEEGRLIPGTGELLKEDAFTISLKPDVPQ